MSTQIITTCIIFAAGNVVVHIAVGSLWTGNALCVFLERVMKGDSLPWRTGGDRTAVIAVGVTYVCTVVSQLTPALCVFVFLTLLYHLHVAGAGALPAGYTLGQTVFLINKCASWTGFTHCF